MNNIYQNNSSGILKLIVAVMLSMVTMLPFSANAQLVTQTESFESTIFPAPGWKQLKALSAATGAFVRQPQATATNPVVPAVAGANIMMFNSFTAVPGDTAFMISKPFDFSNCGVTNPTFSFSMYRDNGFAANQDRIQVYVNSIPSFTGATLLTNTAGSTTIFRYNASFPAATANTWNTYTYNLLATTYNGGPKKTYIIVVGIAADGNNIYMDNFQVNTYPSPMMTGDISLDVVQQNFASVGTGTTDQWIIGVRCIVSGNSGNGVTVPLQTAVKLDSMLFNTNGTSVVSDIQNAKVWYTGGSQQFSTAYLSPYPAGQGYAVGKYGQTIAVPATDLDFVHPVPCFHLEYDTTYFWLTYDIKSTATGGNFVDGDFRGASVTPGGGACPTPLGNPTTVTATTTVYEIPGGPQIDIPYCIPTYTVGTKWANYTNNDYVHRVEFLTGVPPSFINTFVNSVSVQDPAAPGYPNCPFAGHPPDYELRPTTGTYGGTVNLTVGMPYTFRAQCGTWYSSNYIQAWIDYNRNGVFEVSERLATPPLTNLSSLQWQNFSFIVPAAAVTGTTRLRVREVYANSNPDPCANYTYGECEDFNITILPNCPPGYKLWLGNTANWNDPANWCGGVPTSADSAVINRVSVPGYGSRNYFGPIIRSNIKANTRGLYIGTQDTLLIDAPNPADTALRIHSSLHLNGKLIVNGGFTSTVNISNGTLENNIYTPFRGGNTDARTQILYSAAELAALGFVANDRIVQIGYTVIPIMINGLPGKNSTQPYSGFTISYGFLPAGTTQFASNAPVATPTIVYGPTAYNTVSGPNLITLTNPIVWDGVSALVIQYCFDNPSTTGNDLLKITQTTGRKTTLVLTATTPNIAPGCNLSPGAGVSDNFFGAAGINRPNFTFHLDRKYGKPYIGLKGSWNNNGTFVRGISQVIMDSSAVQLIQGSNPTTFHELKIHKTAIANAVRLMQPLTIEDTLVMQQGRLEMNQRSIFIQNQAPVSGTAIAGFNGPVSRPANGGIIISEDTLSKFTWDVGAWKGPGVNQDYYVVPFGNNNNVYVPFSWALKSGTMGEFTVSTYATVAANTPWPPTVSHLNNGGGANNGSATADRFWVTTKTGANPVANLTFRWAYAERPTVAFSAFNPARPFPWRVSSNNMGAWIRLFAPTGTSFGTTLGTSTAYTVNYAVVASPPFDTSTVQSFDWPMINAGLPPFNATAGPMPNTTPWAVAGQNANALPVELLNFTAKQEGARVKINWNTASEIDNDYFTVERSDADQIEYDFIAKVNSYFNNSSVPLYYESWDNKPLIGLNYYRLKQTDLNGDFTYYGPVAVEFDPSKMGDLPFDIISTYPDQLASGIVNVEFSYNSDLPLSYRITDATGRVVSSANRVAADYGMNKITLNQSLTRGMYIITLYNEKEAVSRRFVY